MTVGEKIKARCEELGIAQFELANKIGMTEVSLSRCIRGDRVFKGPYLANIARALDMPIKELIDGYKEELDKNTIKLTKESVDRQQAIEAVKEPVRPMYVWVGSSVKEIEAIKTLVESVVEQAQRTIAERIEHLPPQGLTVTVEMDEERVKSLIEDLKKGGATIITPEEDEWLPVDLEHNQPPLEEWVLVSSEEYVTRDAVVIRNGKKIWYHNGEIQEDDRWRYPPEPYHPPKNEKKEESC